MSDSDEWYTPDTEKHPVLTLVSEALNGIGLDPTADSQKRVQADLHYTKEDDCLTKTAQGKKIFCNPPFSDPYPFVLWVAKQVTFGASPEAIMLLKIGTLANKKTGKLIKENASATCEWQYNGRIDFVPSELIVQRLDKEFREGKRDSPKPTKADFDCVLVYFGDNFWRFVEVFEPYGNTALRRRAYKKFI